MLRQKLDDPGSSVKPAPGRIAGKPGATAMAVALPGREWQTPWRYGIGVTNCYNSKRNASALSLFGSKQRCKHRGEME
jgi:hypothetical protein